MRYPRNLRAQLHNSVAQRADFGLSKLRTVAIRSLGVSTYIDQVNTRGVQRSSVIAFHRARSRLKRNSVEVPSHAVEFDRDFCLWIGEIRLGDQCPKTIHNPVLVRRFGQASVDKESADETTPFAKWEPPSPAFCCRAPRAAHRIRSDLCSHGARRWRTDLTDRSGSCA